MSKVVDLWEYRRARRLGSSGGQETSEWDRRARPSRRALPAPEGDALPDIHMERDSAPCARREGGVSERTVGFVAPELRFVS